MEDGVRPTTQFKDWELLQWSESDSGTASDGESQGFEMIDEEAAASAEDAEQEVGQETRDRINSNYFSVGFAEREVEVAENLESEAELLRVQRHTGSACSCESEEELAAAAVGSKCGDSGEIRDKVVDTIMEKLQDSSVGLAEEAGFDDVSSEINRAAAAAPSESPRPSVADSGGEGEGYTDIGKLDHKKREAAQNKCPEMTSVVLRSENEFSGECSESVEAAGIVNSALSPAGPHPQSDLTHNLTEKGGKVSGDSNGTGGKATVVWWKFPLELLKFCILKVRPIWSISIAAVMVGAAMLARRLNKMRRSSRLVPSKVRVDDKKVSQFLVTARLSTAYPMAKHAPVIKSSLRMDEITPWLAMTLR